MIDELSEPPELLVRKLARRFVEQGRHRLFRAAWITAWTLLARWTPPPFHPWRRLVLRLFGARVAPAARVYASARIWYPPNLAMGPHSSLGPHANCYAMDRVTIGAYATVSQGAQLCAGTHDVDSRHFQLNYGRRRHGSKRSSGLARERCGFGPPPPAAGREEQDATEEGDSAFSRACPAHRTPEYSAQWRYLHRFSAR